MRVLVTYMSKTGNTKKVAEAIYEEIREDREIRPVDQVDSLEKCDLAFLGFPIHGEGPDKKTLQFLEKHCVSGRNVALFITHASPEGNPELQPMLEKFRQAAHGANIVAMFDCQGELAKAVKVFMSIMPNAKYRRWAKEDNSKGQPDETRIARARAFSRDVMRKFRETPASQRARASATAA